MSQSAPKSPVSLSSTVFPTADDVMMWQGMSADEKRAYLNAELEAARQSGIGDKSMNDLWAEADRIATAAKENAL